MPQLTKRAKYGKNLLKRLSKILSSKLGRGFSVDTLELMRKIYTFNEKIKQNLTVKSIELAKSETTFRILDTAINKTSATSEMFFTQTKSIEQIWQVLFEKFDLSWSHYVVLMRISLADERKFYEIEAIENNWGIRELKRMISSSLYERLALSRDKNSIKELSLKGQLIATPSDVLKSPYVLEFLGMEENSSYSEHELEVAS